jgi:hypothetical protein
MEIDHPAENRLHESLDERLRKLDRLTRAPLDEMPNGSFTSSNVHSALYDFGERELYVRYLRDGARDAIYRYDNVDARTWQSLEAAASKGSYINANVAFEFNYARINAGQVPDDSQAMTEPRVRRFVTTP